MPEPSRRPWSPWVLLPLGLVGPFLVGIILIQEIPHPLSSNGSVLGLELFPFAAAVLVWLFSRRAAPGQPRMTFIVVAGLGTVVWLVIFFLGMLAP